MLNKLTSSVSGIFVFLFLINIISRVLGFFREILFANFFGTQKEFDVYLIASVIPTTIGIIILYIGQNYFIPAYNSQKKNEDQGIGFFKSNVFIFFIIGLSITTLLFILTPQIVSIFINKNQDSYFILTSDIFRILLITLPVSAVISIISAYNQAEMDFVPPAISRLFLNVAIIPIVIFSSKNIGIFSIAIGLSAGIILQFLYLFIKLKMKDKWKFNSYIKNKSKLGKNFTSVILSIIVIESISQLYSLSDRLFYNVVDSGGIAALNYAYNIFMLPISIISVSLSTIIFSKISEYFSGNSNFDINKYISEFLKSNFVIFIFISISFFLFGDIIISLLFQRGKFNSSDTHLTFSLLQIYSISLIFYSAYSLYNKILYSSKLIFELLIITILGVVVKIIFNFILVQKFKQDGLAISTVLSFLFFFISSTFIIKRKLKIHSRDNYFHLFIFYTLSILLSFTLSILIFGNIPIRGVNPSIFSMILFTLFFLGNLIVTKDSILEYVKKIRMLFG